MSPTKKKKMSHRLFFGGEGVTIEAKGRYSHQVKRFLDHLYSEFDPH